MRVALVLLVACIGSAAAQKLSVSIASFKNNDEVTVHLSEVAGATGNDVVALYFAGGDPGMTRPLKCVVLHHREYHYLCRMGRILCQVSQKSTLRAIFRGHLIACFGHC